MGTSNFSMGIHVLIDAQSWILLTRVQGRDLEFSQLRANVGYALATKLPALLDSLETDLVDTITYLSKTKALPRISAT